MYSFMSGFFHSILFVGFFHIVCNFHSLSLLGIIIPLNEHTTISPFCCKGTFGLFPVFLFLDNTKNITIKHHLFLLLNICEHL